MKILKEKIKNIMKSEEIWLVLISLVYGLIISCSKMGGDDLRIIQQMGTNVIDWWKYSVDLYYTWSSRQLINFVWFTVAGGGRIVWMIYMSFSMYVMLKALVLLFSDGNRKEIVIYAVSTVMLFPFDTQSTAGWIATTTSYFGPQAFALMSLVPIKKTLKNEKIRWWEFILYCICLIYGANAEQMCVLLLVLYSIALIYFIRNKKCNWQICFLLLLAIISLVYMATCPGNWDRGVMEEANRFPTYGMLNAIDKADIGLSTTLKWIFADGRAFIIVMCVLFAFFIWKKYKEPFFRMIALIPACITLLIGPLSSLFTIVFPYAHILKNGVNYYGEFTVEAAGKGTGMLQFGIFLILVICVCVEIILLNDSVPGFIADAALIATGVASRCMMGFSPTVYASSTRTYTTMIVCLMAVSVHVYSSNCHLLINADKHNIRWYVMGILTVMGFLDLMFLVATRIY